MRKNRIIALALAAMLLLPALALAEVTQKTDFGGGFYEISYFASEQDKKEGHPLRTEYYSGRQLQASKTYQTMEDGTLRTDSLDANGALLSYSLFKTENGQAVTQDFDPNGNLLSTSQSTGDRTTNTVILRDESGKQTGSRVITSFNAGLIRYEMLDAEGKLVSYEIETPSRKDSYDAEGRLMTITLTEMGENGSYIERVLDARGEMTGYSVRTTDDKGVTRTEQFDSHNELKGYTLTKMTDSGIVTESYDANNNLLSTQQGVEGN